MPEFILPPKYKQLFNEYDLSVIKADHYVSEREDLRLYRNTFLERIWTALSESPLVAAPGARNHFQDRRSQRRRVFRAHEDLSLRVGGFGLLAESCRHLHRSQNRPVVDAGAKVCNAMAA